MPRNRLLIRRTGNRKREFEARLADCGLARAHQVLEQVHAEVITGANWLELNDFVACITDDHGVAVE